ncbi:MAG: DUF6448 family protein [Candidatus Nanopelagicales bacterium]
MTAARRALDGRDVEAILPFVPEDAEDEVRQAFDRAQGVRGLGPQAREVADLHFFETVVRLHRAGEGAPYTGLKAAGLDVGPVIPLAEHALESGSIEALHAFLSDRLREQLTARLDHALALRDGAGTSVPATRDWVEAMLGFQVYSHHLYRAMHQAHH